jgi:hypothetical protein
MSGGRLLERVWGFGVQSLRVGDVLERIRGDGVGVVRAVHGRDVLERVRGDWSFGMQPV